MSGGARAGCLPHERRRTRERYAGAVGGRPALPRLVRGVGPAVPGVLARARRRGAARPARRAVLHDLDLSEANWQATQPCGPDHYEICYLVGSPDVVQEFWRVRGPDKNYVAVATLTRSSART